MFLKIIILYSNTQKGAFYCIGGTLGELPNQRRETVSRDIIQLFKSVPE